MRQLASFFLLLCPLSMTAQTVTNDSTQTIDEVVVKGFRIPGNVLASTPIQTLSHTDMERLGIHDMGDALKRFAGVQVKDYGGIGGMKTVNIRGLGAGHTGVTYDGVQVGDCQSGQVDLSRFTLDNVSTRQFADWTRGQYLSECKGLYLSRTHQYQYVTRRIRPQTTPHNNTAHG